MKSLLIVLCLLISACSTIPSSAERRGLADSLAAKRGWQAVTLSAGNFDLVAYVPGRPIESDALTIYIEGDGFAWISGSQPSPDPTPRDPLALRLALAHPDGQAAYLGRPCQYVGVETANCASRYWTEKRFAPEVIAATNRAIDALKQRLGASRLTLVGYSGGGAVAALVAAGRGDVERLVTIAGNLDHRAWTAYHRIRPLDGSLNPVDEIDALRTIPQWHFVGGRDRNIAPELVQAFADRFPDNRRPVVVIEREFEHRCCWAENWPTIWRQTSSLR